MGQISGAESDVPQQEDTKNVIYIGTKIVKAEPMDHFSFLTLKGQPIPDHENSPGYKVVYDDGYTSWSPQNVFERCYRPLSGKEAQLIRHD